MRALLVFALACGGAPANDAGRDAGRMPVEIVCTEASCPPLAIEGQDTAAIPFRGIGDPSLVSDGATLWLLYSHLAPIGTGDSLLFGVGVHLARSDDGGASFALVSPIEPVTANDPLYTMHEVSSLAIDPSGAHAVWLDYVQEAVPGGRAARDDIVLVHTSATNSVALASSPRERWLRGSATADARFGPELVTDKSCAVFTEPDLFAHDGTLYLVANCIAAGGYSLELFTANGGSLAWIGTLLDTGDARALGANSLEQADLSIARDGRVLLIVTPVAGPLSCDGALGHRGCTVLEIDDLSTAGVRREGGEPYVRAHIDAGALSSGPGPGLCTYDANSETGVLIVTTTCGADGLTFTTRRTGFHP